MLMTTESVHALNDEVTRCFKGTTIGFSGHRGVQVLGVSYKPQKYLKISKSGLQTGWATMGRERERYPYHMAESEKVIKEI